MALITKYRLSDIITANVTRFINYSISQRVDYLSNFLGIDVTINGDEIMYDSNVITEEQLIVNGVNLINAFDQTQAAASWTHMFGPSAEPDPDDVDSILL